MNHVWDNQRFKFLLEKVKPSRNLHEEILYGKAVPFYLVLFEFKKKKEHFSQFVTYGFSQFTLLDFLVVC